MTEPICIPAVVNLAVITSINGETEKEEGSVHMNISGIKISSCPENIRLKDSIVTDTFSNTSIKSVSEHISPATMPARNGECADPSRLK